MKWAEHSHRLCVCVQYISLFTVVWVSEYWGDHSRLWLSRCLVSPLAFLVVWGDSDELNQANKSHLYVWPGGIRSTLNSCLNAVTMRGPSSALGPFQRGLGRPGTSGESHGDVEIGKTEVALWQAACLLSQWAEEKERKRIDTFVSSLLLPLWGWFRGEKWKGAGGFGKVTLKLLHVWAQHSLCESEFHHIFLFVSYTCVPQHRIFECLVYMSHYVSHGFGTLILGEFQSPMSH